MPQYGSVFFISGVGEVGVQPNEASDIAERHSSSNA
jgi:hypothetical protein